jgi:hypothetical protein
VKRYCCCRRPFALTKGRLPGTGSYPLALACSPFRWRAYHFARCPGPAGVPKSRSCPKHNTSYILKRKGVYCKIAVQFDYYYYRVKTETTSQKNNSISILFSFFFFFLDGKDISINCRPNLNWRPPGQKQQQEHLLSKKKQQEHHQAKANAVLVLPPQLS